MSITNKIFIVHASEDKYDVARPLANKLLEAGFNVWYDEYSLDLGDNLRRKIEEGLIRCSFGVVILSPNFFARAKTWPARELDVLFLKEDEGNKVILPIWHGVGKAEVSKYSGFLAAKIAVSTKVGLDEVTTQISRAISRELEKRKSKFDQIPKLQYLRYLMPVRITGSTICEKAKNVFAHHAEIPIANVKDIEIVLFEDLSGCDEDKSYIELQDGTRVTFQEEIILAAAAKACPSLIETHIPTSWDLIEPYSISENEETVLSEHELVVAFIRNLEEEPSLEDIRFSLLAISQFSDNYPMSEHILWWGSQSYGRKLIRTILSSGNFNILQDLLNCELSSNRRAAFLCAKSIVEETIPRTRNKMAGLIEFLLSKQSPLNDHWKAKIKNQERNNI